MNTLFLIKYFSKILFKLCHFFRCSKNGRELKLKELNLNLNVKREKHEYNVQLEGDKSLTVMRNELENGIEPFRDISIFSYEINKVDDSSAETSDESNEKDESLNSNVNPENDIVLSKCQIRITPERNVMAPTQNNEKIMFLQNLLDQFGFEFKETSDSVLITGKLF